MTGFGVRFTATALRQVEEISAWWVTNRAASPDLFLDELSASLDRLARVPEAGAGYGRLVGGTEVRRLLLRRAGYHVYYTVRADTSEVLVRAVWHATRGRGPLLK